jgi:hypothetical protein
VKKQQIPLRKLKSKTSFLNERFDNILKRNVLGEYSRPSKRRNKNSKLNKIHLQNGIGTDYGFDLDEDSKKLKIFD